MVATYGLPREIEAMSFHKLFLSKTAKFLCCDYCGLVLKFTQLTSKDIHEVALARCGAKQE